MVHAEPPPALNVDDHTLLSSTVPVTIVVIVAMLDRISVEVVTRRVLFVAGAEVIEISSSTELVAVAMVAVVIGLVVTLVFRWRQWQNKGGGGVGR